MTYYLLKLFALSVVGLERSLLVFVHRGFFDPAVTLAL